MTLFIIGKEKMINKTSENQRKSLQGKQPIWNSKITINFTVTQQKYRIKCNFTA